MQKQILPILILSTALWGIVDPSVTAQNSSAAFPTPEAAVRADLLEGEGSELPYPAFTIEPIVYAGDYAMAGWTWGEGGGISVALQRNGSWSVVCGTGGVYGTVEELQQFCQVPRQTAQALLQAWMNVDQTEQRVAEVFDPPSNVRLTPGGEILCSVQVPTVINIYEQIGDWYYTDACGQQGVIHSSQIRF